MLPFTRSSNLNRALCRLTLGLALLMVTVSAQGRRDQFIIRVAELPSDLGDARAGGVSSLNFGDLSTTGLGGGATQTELQQAPDVVVEGLNLLQRNDLVAAAGNAEPPRPQQRLRLNLNSGLRRR
ncbi:uncharacterized protein LOC129239073 [Anastrepha obliqua]|uniref:uncharacterized protein LOC129239073 n=1 Tax=Anastrepha obliqua TaxID=95512 RepID=UPI00240960EA|nr:uncharacterized protein LOC129239073 [Anastrepha obliqua]